MTESKMAEVPFVASSPDPEVGSKAQRRKFSVADKKRILDEVDRATGHGAIGAILRRERVYSSTLHQWRKERDAAVDQAFSQKRGPRPERNPLAGENEKLRRQNQRLRRKNWRSAHIVIDVQKSGQAVGLPAGRGSRCGEVIMTALDQSLLSSGRSEASLPGVGGSARDLVSAPAAPCFSSYRPAFGSAFVAGAVGRSEQSAVLACLRG